VAEGGPPIAQFHDVRISPLPFAHVGTMTRVWEELEHRITTVIAPTPWTAGETLTLMARERVTVAQGVPTQYRLLFDHPDFAATDLSAVRVAGVGAARVPPELVVEMKEKLGCPVTVRYSSTEMANGTGTRLTDDPQITATTVGRPNGRIELRLTSEDGSVVDRPGAVGTVNIRSRAMMRGYWRDPERTAQTIGPDGWLITGDLGWIGDDGNLRLVGRHHEMYIRGGYNVYPGEVENVLGGHPKVAGCAVLGAPAVDDQRGIGEIGVVFCVPADPSSPPTLAELRQHVRDRLADYKAPDVLVIVDTIPVTSLGKPDKLSLRARAEQEARTWRR
jgi:acyl-CoA synthetase (AMP-forming)/AMP-acid ligase II